ncbi:hypothetical protein BsWGS_22667 [Bradybaena similaris]
MNSPIKDAFTEFINNNTSAIEQAMENSSHDLTKDEPVIPDLVNYLSCPSPQPCNKDIEPMSTNEKVDTHNAHFDPGHGQTHYNPCPLQDIPESNQFPASQMCVTGADVVLNQDLQPQHHLSHQNSFEQNTSLYSDSSIQPSSTACAFPDSQLVNTSAFAGPASSSTEMHTALNAGGTEPQYCHTEPSGQFQVVSDTGTHSQPTQLMSTDNCVEQTRSETSAGGFQDSSVLSSFSSSVGSEVSFGQDGLGFSLLTVNQVPRSNLDRVAGQFRAPEKMHVDEPDTVYGRATGIDHFQTGAIHTTGPADLHMQTFSSDAFNAASAFVAQQSPSVADTGLQDCAAASVADHFSSHNFQPSPAVLQGSCVDFQTQANIRPANDVITEQAHFLPQQPESSGSAETLFSCATQHTCGSSQPSPYQTNQYYNSPGLCEATPGMADSFQKSVPPTDSPAPNPSCGPSHQFDLISSNTDCGHFQQSVASLQPHQQSVASLQPQLDLAQFHQSPAVDMGFSPSVSLAHGQVQPGVSFHASVPSDLSTPAHFPASAPAESPPHDYLTDTVSTSPAQVKDSTAFLGCSAREDPLLSAGMCSQAGATDYQMSPGHGQGLTASNKTSSDVTMRDFSLEGNLHSPSHRFPDDSFIHLDLEAVVNSLSVETHSSSATQNDSILSSVSYQPSYNEYDYNRLSAAPVSFQGMSVAAAATSTFSEHSKPDTGFTSCTPELSASTFASDAGDENSHHQFGSSSFVFAATSEAAPAQTYHQPMQVQDSEPHVTYSYPSTNVSDRIVNNTETAMEVSSSLSDKVAGVTSGMSYEEIHMSIVKAGNELSKEAHDTNILHPHADFGNPPAHTANLDSLSSVSNIFSTSSSEMFPPEKPDSNVAAAYHTAGGQTSPLMTSGNEQHESSFSCNTSLSNSITSSSVDSSSIFSGILSDLQAACTSSGTGHDTQHSSATVPNFLENTGPMISNTHTDNISTAGLTQGPAQSNFIITMAATPTVSQSLVASASLNPPAVVVMQHADIDSSQQQPVVLSTGSQSVNAPGNPQIFAAVINPAQASAASFLGQLQTAGVDQTSSSLAANQLVPTPAAASLDSVSGAASGTFLHMAPAHVERASASPATSGSSIKLAANTLTTQKSCTSSTAVAGLTPVSLSSVSPSQVLASSVSKQPHIIVSLEELQRLLAQQNLSQPSASVPQQQPYTSLSSPQTLVLQKHASHSLKQSQPRLLIKGATLPSQPRQPHPHQQLQQTREKLQLLMHHSQPSDHTPAGKFSQRSSETSTLSTPQENQQKVANPFSFVSQLEQLPQSKLHVLQHPGEQKVKLQLKPAQLLQRQPQTLNLFLQQVPKSGDQKLAPLQLGHQQGSLAQHKSHSDHKPFVHIESHLQNPPHFNQRGLNSTQKTHNLIQLAQMQQELLLLLKQEEKGQEFERQQLQQFHLKHQQHLQPLEKQDKTDRTCSDSLRKDYKHLHSLLTGEAVAGGTQAKVLPPMLNLASTSQGQSGLQLASAGVSSATPTVTSSSATHISAAPFSLLPLNSNTSLHLTGTNSTLSSTPLSTLAFVKSITSPAASKTFDLKDFSTEHSSCLPGSLHAQFPVKSEHGSTDQDELDLPRHQPALLLQTSTERKRSHTPLSVDLNSPANSGSEAGSPLASPTICEDGNTQLTLIERSADLHIKSDSMLGAEDEDVDDNSSFDVNAFHKRPSAGEFHSTRGNSESVPMKIAKSSINTTAHLGANSSTSLESTFDFGSAVTSASSFSFAFGNKEDNSSELFTFGLNGTATTAATTTTTTDTLPHKDGAKPYRLSSSKPVMKTVGMRTTVPTQPVRPMSRKQKEHSLKAYYPSKLDGMELKILEQPEPQHRARYQTEGSRGAIKDASQQGFPVIKLFGYSKPAKLQVFIGDECGRVKPHGFYQACRVFGKNSTACVEQEIEDTTVIEVEMLPENDMTVRLDCVGILKLRNADVERRIGPKRAREKKKTNTRARLVMRCLVVKSDGNQQILQAVSNPIVCTQPVGQPEISRMSLSESSVLGGDSLFIIGKNFKNKGTSVLFQKLDSSEDHVVWQVEADIEQEFFQPTHLICKIPPYQDPTVDHPQLAQIVISCAGKRSDPQAFMYTPVYPAATSVKRDTPMDTDHMLSTQSVSLASSEALHLNRLVHLTNTHPASTSSVMFQLPQGSLTGRQTSAMELTPANISTQISQPVKLLDHTATTAPMVATAPTTTASAALLGTVRPESSMTSVTPGQGQPSFLLEDSVPEPGQNASERSSSLSSVTEQAPVNCVVHSNSDTRTISAVSYAVSDNHQQPSLTSSGSAGQVLHSNKLPANKSASVPSKPFFLVVDPVALQSNVGSEKIQQLLQHILEAQSKA